MLANIHISLALPPNHWSNLKSVIIFPYLPAKKKKLVYPEDQRSLIIMNTFKGQDNEEMK